MSKTVTYYLAPQSPWTYLGHDRFVALALRHGATVDLRPIDLGKVFPLSGGLPLAQRARQRQLYRLTELKRWSEFLRIPLNQQPKFFPVAGDPAAKLIVAALEASGTGAAMKLAGAVLRAVWAEEADIADEATLDGLARACGMDGAALLERSRAPQVQERYDAFTREAIDAQVFGAPTYALDGELFWGQDRLDFLDRALARA